jgi:hypothetical protein
MDDSERERVQLAGGFVIFGRVGGTLAVSRAFGDKPFKVPHSKVGLAVRACKRNDVRSRRRALISSLSSRLCDHSRSKPSIDFSLWRAMAYSTCLGALH